jgi:SAM-dependent methyltransferase
MKLHICCGDVYLKDYINIDIEGYLVNEYKEENINLTTIDKYYKYKFDTEFIKRQRRTYIIDKKMNVLKRWEFEDNSIEEIIMISAIEHFNKKDAEFIVNEIKRVLKPKGKFIVDFPNIKEDVNKYYYSNPNFLMELIYCNHKNELSTHKWGYTYDSFKNLLGSGWQIITETTIIEHDYPMIGILAVKE